MEKEAPHRDPSNVFDPEKAAPFLFAGGHPGWLGLTYLGHGEDWTEIRLPWREELMGDDVRRVIASGPIFSMLDMGGGIAIWTRAQRFVPIATLDMRVDYQRPAGERARRLPAGEDGARQPDRTGRVARRDRRVPPAVGPGRAARERADVIARCECYRTTRSAAFVRGIAHDGDPDDPVATMAAVYMTIGDFNPAGAKND